ncbi:MAG TPA: RsmB/NOP family class I SAM-dependent RNA methyltransferase [Burkholderiales bacterium]|nr:RsmB/NOP family class I SAM-dependent RNA methyltransferase [Burkholderiales bacterium]
MAVRITPALLETLADLTARALRFERAADKVLSDYFRAHPKLGQGERGFLAETVYAGLRRKRLVDYILAEVGPVKPQARLTPVATARAFALITLARVRGVNLRELGLSERSEEGAWLQRVKAAARGELPFEVRCDLPDWVIARLRAHLPDERILAYAEGLQQPAPLDLRVNLLKSTRDAVQRQLAAEGLRVAPTPYAPTGLRLLDKPALQRHALFLDGTIEVQDEGSQLLCHLLGARRGEMVADFCAGAGGKTLALAALMRSTGRLYAFDVAEKRLARLKPRLARSGASNVDARHITSEHDARLGRLAGKLDRVLVDAPCSGLGTLRRNPDLKWRQDERALAELRIKQASILAAAARLVKAGGRLVYATCSFLPEENEEIVADFLATHPSFELVRASVLLESQLEEVPAQPDADGFLRLVPNLHGTDGFYAAALVRKSAA